MSGTSMGHRPSHRDGELTPAEQHLGDRLAALVDGELGHEARERVLSHLATCWSCKAEAEAQRRLKNVFADTAPPPPSDGLLARLQGLPAGGPDGPSADGGGGGEGGAAHHGRTGRRLPHFSVTSPESSPLDFDYLPSGHGRAGSALTPSGGFRIHETERQPSRGRRFAFAAAGAVSLAALALGGALGSGTSGTGSPIAAGDGGSSASAVRTAASAASSSDRDRRRRDVNAARAGERQNGAVPVSMAGAATGAPLAPALGRSLRRHSAWAAPAALLSAPGRPSRVYPLLRNAAFTPPPIASAPAPTPAAPAAPPGR